MSPKKLNGRIALITGASRGIGAAVARLFASHGAHVILNTRGSTKWMMEAIKLLPDLKMISTCSIGTDMIDLIAAKELGITVSNQPGRTAPVVAEQHHPYLVYPLI